MLAEVLIFVPSIANYRVNWLQMRLSTAHVASLAADTDRSGEVPVSLRRQLLMTAKVKAVAVKRDGIRRLVLPSDVPLVIDASYDLQKPSDLGLWSRVGLFVQRIGHALYVFVAPSDRLIRIYGNVKMDGGQRADQYVEVILPELPLRAAMVQHGLNILGLSIIISLAAAAAVYFTLIRVLVKPMMRLTDSMLHFSENPEDAERIIAPHGTGDEIGVAEVKLAEMQRQLNQLLHQRKRLADLGLAVSKINHDLRNMLSSAQLISDRLSELPDPTVQRFAPKLIASLDRAINFCNDTLRFGSAQEEVPRREMFLLAPLIDEVGDGLNLPRARIEWEIDVPRTLQIDADREQLFRVLNNLCRNAAQAIEAVGPQREGTISIRAQRNGPRTVIHIRDNGPGVPAKARENLFKAFRGGARKGGTGLGLAISAELVQAHQGELSLLDTDYGAAFQIDIPDRSAIPRS